MLGVDMSDIRVSEAYLRCLSDSVNEDLGIDWLRVRLPCTVQAALLEHGLIEDPYTGKNFLNMNWIAEHGWVYRIPINSKTNLAYVVLYGVDYRCIVRHRDKVLATHEGMFSPILIRLENCQDSPEIFVHVWSSGRHAEYPFPRLKKDMHFSMSYGWDFAPRIITVGVWDDVEIWESRGVFIRDFHVNADLEGNISVEISLDGVMDEFDVRISIEDEEEGVVLEHVEHVAKGQRKVRITNLCVENPKLWWPWDMGNTHSYRISIDVILDGETLDHRSGSFGFRESAWKDNRLLINGKKVFVRGVNWVPMDSLLRFSTEKYKRLLRGVRDLNANLIRVWGGGIRERRVFYDLTDAMGLMVWQEFPFACENVVIDESMERVIIQEVKGIVNLLRNHPSIVLWCGGNEMNFRRFKPISALMKRIVNECCPEVVFRPVSPFGCDSHSWYVWYDFASIWAYMLESSEFISEFGMQSLPCKETLTRFMERSIWPPNFLWIIHNAQIGRILYYTLAKGLDKLFCMIEALLEDTYRMRTKSVYMLLNKVLNRLNKLVENTNIDTLIRKSQVIQAMALKLAIENFRLRREKYGGCILWQYNDSWPCISWSILDYYEKKKYAYHVVKMIYEPLQAFIAEEKSRLHVYILNDYNAKKDIIFKLYRNSELLINKKIVIAPQSAICIARLNRDPGIYKTIILDRDKQIRNFYTVSTPRKPSLIDRLLYWIHRFFTKKMLSV